MKVREAGANLDSFSFNFNNGTLMKSSTFRKVTLYNMSALVYKKFDSFSNFFKAAFFMACEVRLPAPGRGQLTQEGNLMIKI